MLVTAVRFTDDLSTTKIQVKWKDTDPHGTVVATQRHFPAPASLNDEELDKAHREYGTNIATWCDDVIGGTVGDGECWTLVQKALQDLANTYQKYGKEPPLISQGRAHGYCILAIEAFSPGSNSGMLQLADVRRGDILQMESAHFRTVEKAPVVQQEWGRWQKGNGEKKVRMAHHTAVIMAIESNVIKVVEQNGTIPYAVSNGQYDLEEMQKGSLKVYRVVGEKWCPPLTADWD